MRKITLFLILFTTLLSCNKQEEIISIPLTPTFKVTLNSEDGGSLSSSGGTYILGSKISVTVVPDNHYLFNKWSDGSTDNPREILVNKDIELTASFNKKTYHLSLSIDGNGVVNETVVVNSSRTELSYKAQTVVRLTSTPNNGWLFSKWVIDDNTYTENPIDIKIEKGSSVVAYFIRDTFELNLNVIGSGTIKEEVIVQPSQYEYETITRLTAVPADGWEFVSWSGDVESNENPIQLQITSNTSITALFTEIEEPITIRVSENIIPNPHNMHSLTSATLGGTHGVVRYSISGSEFLFFSPGGHTQENKNITGESILFKRVNDKWEYVKSFYNEEFESVRNVRKINETTYVMADSTENFIEDIQNGSPIGRGTHMWLVEFSYEDVSIKRISTNGGYYHDVSYGDINGDGLFDVVAAGGPGQFFLQRPDGTFKEYQDVFPVQNGAAYFSIEVGELYGDSTPEIIWTSYIDGGAAEHLNSWVIMKWNPTTEKFYEIQRSDNHRVFHPTGDMGGNKTRIVDINKDGNNDIIIGREGDSGSYKSSIEVWLGDGNGNFSPHDMITDNNDFMLIEFELMDVNHDGYEDIVLVGGGGYNSLRLGNTFEEGFHLNDLIYLNNGYGTFDKFNSYDLIGGVGTTFGSFIPFMNNGNLTFIGTLVDRTDNYSKSRTYIFEVEFKNVF